MKSVRVVVACASIALSCAAAAQVPPNPGGMPQGPGPRPLDMGEMDRATTPTERDQLSIATERARVERAAHAARSARPAEPSEVVAGSTVNDNTGMTIGTIESIAADGAVVSASGGRVRVPLEAFGMASGSLLLAMTKAEFDAIVASASQQP
jgi:hypothetical protein